jgi:hypothetical protein
MDYGLVPTRPHWRRIELPTQKDCALIFVAAYGRRRDVQGDRLDATNAQNVCHSHEVGQ